MTIGHFKLDGELFILYLIEYFMLSPKLIKSVFFVTIAVANAKCEHSFKIQKLARGEVEEGVWQET